MRSANLTTRVLKAMGLFSSLQVVNILCAVVKMKLVALWLGASGVGLFGIYQSVVDMLGTLTDMGIRQSAVRDVAASKGSRLAIVALVVRRWSLLAGLLGAILIALGAPLLSRWFFGSWWAVWGFLLLSVAMFLNSVTGGEQALLQGSGRLKALARGNLWGTVAGFLISIPMFRFMGEKSVALSIVAYAVAMYVCMHWQRVRVSRPSEAIGLRQVWAHGKGFVRLGLCMAIAAFVTACAHTIFTALVNSFAGTAALGYVQAGDTIIVRYLGLVFTAIGMEFYPRLAAAGHNRRAMQAYVNHEIMLLLLILTPLLLLFILLREPVVRLLYTSDFFSIIPFITWGALCSIPKAVSWCMAFTIVSRGDGKIYVLTEGLDALISVPLCFISYRYWGMTGLGVAYIGWYMIYALIAGVVYYRRYRMRLSVRVWMLSLASLGVCTAAVFAKDILTFWTSALLLSLAALACLPPLMKMLRHK